MLQFARKNMYVIIWICVVIFVLWGVGSTIMSGKSGVKPVGEVFGKKIPPQEFQSAYKTIYYSPKIQSMIQEKGSVDEKMIVDSVFQHIAFVHEAKKRGIKVNDQELLNEIVRRFSADGNFNKQVYEGWVTRYAGMSTRNYEEGVREELYIRKLIESVRNAIVIEDKEVEEYFYKENRKIKVAYTAVSFDDFKKDIEPSREELVEYYQANLDSFKTERKFTLDYVLFKNQDFSEDIEIQESEMMTYFEENKESFTDPSSETAPSFEDVKEQIKATLVQEKARALAGVAAENFLTSIKSAYAFISTAMEQNLNSQNMKEKTLNEINTELGWNYNLEKTLASLTDQTVKTIETSIGYAVIHLTNVKAPQVIEFNNAKDKARMQYIDEKAKTKAEEKLKGLYDLVKDTPESFKTLLEEKQISITETDFFNSKEPLEDKNVYSRSIFNELWDKEDNYIGEPLSFENSAAVVKLIAREDPPIEEYEKQKDEIKSRLEEFKRYFEVQGNLSEILKKAEIKKAPDFTVNMQ